MSGFVSLVGAGPGDPELLTLKAARRLAEADLVLYDALVSPETLGRAPRAHRCLVGTRGGRPSLRQETIHLLAPASLELDAAAEVQDRLRGVCRGPRRHGHQRHRVARTDPDC